MHTHPLLVWGGSGHAKMLRPTIARMGREVVALVERSDTLASPFARARRFRTMNDLGPWLASDGPHDLEYLIAIGGHNGPVRRALADALDELGLVPLTVVHERAWVAETAIVGAGCHIMPMAAIGEETVLGRHTIVNTSASVDHECRLGDGVHIMPGATLAGCVEVADNATIGSNATVLPRITVGAGAQVGAGAVVIRDVSPGSVVMGIPARAK